LKRRIGQVELELIELKKALLRLLGEVGSNPSTRDTVV
jgi:hypothetical protein